MVGPSHPQQLAHLYGTRTWSNKGRATRDVRASHMDTRMGMLASIYNSCQVKVQLAQTMEERHADIKTALHAWRNLP